MPRSTLSKLLKSSLRNVRLVIGFEGTRYEGWQSQKKSSSLQEIFEKALSRILKEDKVNLVGSSRTDSGVHALGFVAHFKTHSQLPDVKLKHALNFYLPRDIVVHSAKTVPALFHARYTAKSKVYRYTIWNSKTRPLFQAPFVLWFPHPLDFNRMKKASRYFLGKHDFVAFMDKGGGDKKNTVREIKNFKVTRSGSSLIFEIEGTGFLRHMIRVIMGTLLEVGSKRIKPESVKTILLSKERKNAGATIRALGLTLVKVKY